MKNLVNISESFVDSVALSTESVDGVENLFVDNSFIETVKNSVSIR